MELARALHFALHAYAVLGLIIGGAFVLLAIGRLDPAARGFNPLFRLIVLPGAALLWPWVLWRWVQTLRRRAPTAPDPEVSP
ncbi:MAG: hypothetical protein ACFCBW_09880 [Candidatus Competibacterales bacterium]